jgi:hypothetical protein
MNDKLQRISKEAIISLIGALSWHLRGDINE